MKNINSVGLTLLLALTVSCGSDDDGGGSDNCTGTRLTDDKLCSLMCNQTTMADAMTILGQPTASGSGLLQYNYTCVDGVTGSGMSWDLFFGTTLNEVRLVSVGKFAGSSLPACLATCTR